MSQIWLDFGFMCLGIFLCFILATLQDLWVLSSLTKNQTQVLSNERAEF